MLRGITGVAIAGVSRIDIRDATGIRGVVLHLHGGARRIGATHECDQEDTEAKAEHAATLVRPLTQRETAQPAHACATVGAT